jgi:predicted Rossmann fold flavoprotein
MPLKSDWEVVVVGAGAAGLMAATRAAECGRKTLLLEKNRKPGVKILMSGGTRCNITQATDNRGIIAAYGPPGRFLHSALAALSVQDTIALFESEGVATKREETGKIFPVSDKAADVLGALLARLSRTSCELAFLEPLVDVRHAGEHFELTTQTRMLTADAVILTTGGQSYPGCGTTGDGYHWARQLGHTIVTPRPALVPLTVDVPWVHAMRGITLPDVVVRVVETAAEGPQSRVLAERRASLLWTHFGFSGPAALDVSRAVSGHDDLRRLRLELDLMPDVPEAALDAKLAEAALQQGKQNVSSLLPDHLPSRLAAALLTHGEIFGERRCAELSKPDRTRLIALLKRLSFPLSGTLGFKKAEVTAGGVDLLEVDSRTMESKRTPGLFLAGEILDLDGPIGGYNFQAAWSTGYLAGQSASS